MCFHLKKLVGGFGMYGDAYVCVQCGWTAYYVPAMVLIFGRVVEEYETTPADLAEANAALARNR